MCSESLDYFVYPGTTPDFLGLIPRFCRSKSCAEYTVCVEGWVDLYGLVCVGGHVWVGWYGWVYVCGSVFIIIVSLDVFMMQM